jgi:excisionase family DNA binding protein
MTQDFYSVEQVAERLGLHAKTVRGYIREGKLNAVRIGKQYRIAHADLAALTGGAVPPPLRERVVRKRKVAVSTIVEIDAIGREAADRLTTHLMGAAGARDSDSQERLRVQSLYDAERAHLKLIVLGDARDCGRMLSLVDALLDQPR